MSMIVFKPKPSLTAVVTESPPSLSLSSPSSPFLFPFRDPDLLSFRGDSFFFAQYIYTMEQFRDGEVRIDIPNAAVFFPKKFDEQIARVIFLLCVWLIVVLFFCPINSYIILQDYTLATGDPVIRFSCVAINMAKTNTILSTGLPLDSAIIGMTAMVYVNDTAIVCILLLLSNLFFLVHLLFFHKKK